MFEQVKIRSDHSEILRLMILNNDAKEIEDYQMNLYLFDKYDEKAILNPRFLDERPNQYCLLYLKDYMVVFEIGRKKDINSLSSFIPNNSGELILEIKEKDYLRNCIKNVMVATKIKLNKNLKRL